MAKIMCLSDAAQQKLLREQLENAYDHQDVETMRSLSEKLDRIQLDAIRNEMKKNLRPGAVQ